MLLTKDHLELIVHLKDVIHLEPLEGLHTVKVLPAYVGNLLLKIDN